MIKPHKGVIIDMDGVLLDTEKLILDSMVYAADRLGIENVRSLALKSIGKTAAETKQIYIAGLENEGLYNKLMKAAYEQHSFIVKKSGIPIKKGAVELLEYLTSMNYRVGVATSTVGHIARQKLETAKLLDYFNEVICGDMVEFGKPAPDIYLKAAQMIGVDINDCTAIEDSYSGIVSAHRAGIRVIMVPDLLPPTEMVEKIIYAKANNLLEVKDLFIKDFDAVKKNPR